MGSQAFFDAVKTRRSVYGLEATIPIKDEKVQEIVEQALLHAPTAFNGQSNRVNKDFFF